MTNTRPSQPTVNNATRLAMIHCSTDPIIGIMVTSNAIAPRRAANGTPIAVSRMKVRIALQNARMAMPET